MNKIKLKKTKQKQQQQISNLSISRKLTAKCFMIFVAHTPMDILEAYYMIFSQILFTLEVFISKFTTTKNDKNAILQKNMYFYFFWFCFPRNVLIGVYTSYIEKFNNFRLLVCSPVSGTYITQG